MPDDPLRPQTQALLDAVNALDLDALRAMVDDDYGIVDVDPQGRSVVIENKDAWDAYMTTNFAAMRAAGAALSSRVTGYHGEEAGEMGYSVVRFVQRVQIGETVIENPCVATIVWKRTPEGWKEARWHCSPAPA
ncbi:nuclear transport factor 2 family protein [Microbacterium sp. CCNWLW134]|uniref:nuclear transport factor 2 family protein n=1 Tax=Microbacterium sp. CCNWLW134 TaxID=3122064 RepID=UPI00301020A0